MKKTILTVIIVMILAVSTVLLTACGTKMFPVNEERAGKQVTATVNYADRVSIVSVEELYNQFYSYYNYLYTYYQYGYISAEQFQSYMSNLDETFENSNKSLAKSALYSLLCIETLSEAYAKELGDADARVVAMKAASTKGHTYNFNQMSELNRFYSERIAELETIMACYTDYSYVNSAIRSANKDMQDRFDSYLETVKAEYAALDGTEKDTTPEGFTSISIQEKPYRLIYEVDSDATLDTRGLVVVANYAEANDAHGLTVEIPTKYLVTSGFSASSAAKAQEITVTYGGKSATFTVDIVTARPTREQAASNEEGNADDDTKLEAKYSFEVKEADYIKEGMTEAELTEARKEYKFARSAMSRLTKYLEDNYRTYDNYLYSYMVNQLRSLTENTKAEQITLTKAELEAEYNRVVDERKAELAVKSFVKGDMSSLEDAVLQPVHEDSYGYYYVSQVLFKFTEEQSNAISAFKSAKNANDTAIQDFTVNKAKEIGVWLSNPDYDKDATCEAEACTCPHCKNYVLPAGADRPSYTTLDEWYACDENCPCVNCPAKKYLNQEAVNVLDVIADIENALNTVNNDATITANAYEYRQALLSTINEWIYKANEDSGAFSSITKKEYGYLMTAENEKSGMVEAFELACDTLAAYNGRDTYNGKSFADAKAELEAKGVFIESARGGVGGYAWCVSEYGIHFVVLTAYAVDDDFGTVSETTVGETNYDQLGLDYIYNSYDYDADATKGLAVQDGANVTYYNKGTVAAELGASLLSEKVSADYAAFQKDFITKYEESNIKYNPKGYEYMLNKLQENNK